MSPERQVEEIPASSHNKAALLLLAPFPLDFHMTSQFFDFCFFLIFFLYPAMSNCLGAMTSLLFVLIQMMISYLKTIATGQNLEEWIRNCV